MADASKPPAAAAPQGAETAAVPQAAPAQSPIVELSYTVIPIPSPRPTSVPAAAAPPAAAVPAANPSPPTQPPAPSQSPVGAVPTSQESPTSGEQQPATGGTNLQAFSQEAHPGLVVTQVPMMQPSPPPQEAKTLKVEDALTYLDEVKRQFADKPHIYNQFLEIMKSFKAETIDTPGVIQKVSELFRGHNNLILGFNTFLPAGFRIEQTDLPDDKPPQIPGGPVPGIQGMHPMMGAGAQLGLPPQLLGQNMLQQSMLLGAPGVQHAMMREGAPPLFMSPAYFPEGAHPYMLMMNQEQQQQLQQQQLQQYQQQQQQAMQGAAGGQPVEFDHAINYVTKIKRRFQNDSETYKSFLEILHTYQKEQRSIKEVLDQVSELFRDHPDLLKEFTYFLPDGVREKAKQEISKIQNRRRKEEQRKADKKLGNLDTSRDQGKLLKKEGKEKLAPPVQQTSMMTGAQRAHSPVNRPDEVEDQGESGGGRGADRILIQLGRIPRLEKRFFSRAKAALGTRDRWSAFLKCLELFSLEIVTRQELMALCTDLFMAHPELLEEFDRLLASRGVTDDATEDAWFSVPCTDFDFSQTRRCTPSYRLLPPHFPRPRCSERTPLCRAVLNDSWINLPAGAEDYGFKSFRRNQYEDALFRCEDERFDLDLIVEANLSAIRVLEPLAREIKEREEKAKAGDQAMAEELLSFKLDRRTLSVIHLKAIARVYNERATEVFELLRKSPASAIPIILERLHAKDLEWRKLRLKLNENWKEIMEKNYLRSLDHRSWYFRTAEKKTLAAKSILAEIKEAPDRKITIEFGDAFVHRHAASLLNVALERNLSRPELDRCMAGLEKVLPRLIGVKGFGGKANVSTKVGTKVLTRYGMGSIVSANNNLCEVKLFAGVNGAAPVLKVNRDELLEAAPFNSKDTSAESSVAFVGQHGYLFLRFYALLCERLVWLEKVCSNIEQGKPMFARHYLDRNEEGETPQSTTPNDEQPQALFARVLEHIKQLLRGAIDFNSFEDELFNMTGAHCYFLCTIDRLLRHLATHLQSIVLDERAVKVAELASKYTEKKTSNNAAELYRGIAEALLTSSVCQGIKVRFVPGSNPVCPPQTPSQKLQDEGKEDALPILVDNLWETRPSVVVEFLDAIPQSANNPAATSARSLSPVGTDAEGNPIVTEMGELEFALPAKYELKVKSSPSAVVAPSLGEAETTKTKKGAFSAMGEDAPLVVGVYQLEKLPGSDDVFRRILAFKNEQQSTSDKDWWRSNAGVRTENERNVSPVPDDESSSSDEGAPAAPASKRVRTAAAADDAE